MSDNPETSNANGVAPDPLMRLASIKPPRDLSLGGAKANKKVFTPNLNVTRNKKNGPASKVRNVEQDHKGKRERKNDRNKNFKNGPNIIRSSGVFSEGVANAPGHSSHSSSSYSRGSSFTTTPFLQKPTIRVKDVITIDRELDEQRLQAIICDKPGLGLDTEDFKRVLDMNAPVQLPRDDAGCVHNKTKLPLKVKKEVVVKQEPAEDTECRKEAKHHPKLDVTEMYEEANRAELLHSDNPILMLVQLPDTLPGRGGSADEEPRRNHGNYNEPSTSTSENSEQKKEDVRCTLSDLEEGQIGKLQIHRSGRVMFVLGDNKFEVYSGTKTAFHQEVVSVVMDNESRSVNMIELGSIQHKLNITPDWDNIFSKAAAAPPDIKY